ncbi:MAG: hypothetical protein CO107_12795 [Deltaproteobacteria bacterium CG_4_9_14_3_um_filter_51_14]|nr:MAG: hypothetical protein CO107_12795 [Deltaproteobacteria bacterium CG_4_9_14_3_um_filter_51_14]
MLFGLYFLKGLFLLRRENPQRPRPKINDATGLPTFMKSTSNAKLLPKKVRSATKNTTKDNITRFISFILRSGPEGRSS